MPIDFYRADQQLPALKGIIDTPGNRITLGLSTNVMAPDGSDTGVPNDSAVVIQSPYFLMTNYLPQVIIDLQTEGVQDQQFNTAMTSTVYHIYYAMKYDMSTTYVVQMYQHLTFIARTLLQHRACYIDPNTSTQVWHFLELPVIEINNEVNEYYAQRKELIVAGRIVVTAVDKGYYRN